MSPQALFIVFCAVLTTPSLCVTLEEIKLFRNVIISGLNESSTYVPPTNNFQYKPSSYDIKDFPETFDFIIIGAGTAGSVVASRLSEIDEWKVLLLEPGDFRDEASTPARLGIDIDYYSDYNWYYKTVPQKTTCLSESDKRCVYPMGRGIGGGSLINGLVYTRGSPTDYDLWCKQDLPGWCYKDVEPYFRKSERFRKNDPDAVVDWPYHNKDGLLGVEYPIPRSGIPKVFLEATEQLGYKSTDVNGGTLNKGGTPNPVNTRRGTRQDAGTVFIKPFLNRKNLKVLPGSFVTKILINDDNEAEGVLFTYKGVLYRAKANKEVILSAGSINSPQVLMLSGIGPEDHLEDIGIPVVANLSVGIYNDHARFIPVRFDSDLKKPGTTIEKDITDYLEKGIGNLARAQNLQALGFYQTSDKHIPNYPDIEFRFWDSNYTLEAALDYVPPSGIFYFDISLLHTHSFGTIRLKNKSPYEHVVLDTNCISHPKDIKSALRAVDLVFELIKTPAFQSINPRIVSDPVEECSDYKYLSDEYWICAIRYLATPEYHTVYTCKMGADPNKGAVVDTRLRVYGVKNLRVADCSIIPVSLSCHVNAVCYMIGEKASDIIKEDYGKI